MIEPNPAWKGNHTTYTIDIPNDSYIKVGIKGSDMHEYQTRINPQNMSLHSNQGVYSPIEATETYVYYEIAREVFLNNGYLRLVYGGDFVKFNFTGQHDITLTPSEEYWEFSHNHFGSFKAVRTPMREFLQVRGSLIETPVTTTRKSEMNQQLIDYKNELQKIDTRLETKDYSDEGDIFTLKPTKSKLEKRQNELMDLIRALDPNEVELVQHEREIIKPDGTREILRKGVVRLRR